MGSDLTVSHCCRGKQGKCATWDVTVSDTLAQSYVHETSETPGAAAEAAAERKRNKYSSLSQSYLFVPIAAETTGAISKDGMDFLCELGRRITQCTDDHRESAFLFQRERKRDFHSHKAGNQKGHAHQTWCLLFSNISMI